LDIAQIKLSMNISIAIQRSAVTRCPHYRVHGCDIDPQIECQPTKMEVRACKERERQDTLNR
jgi:hypothetical protein